MAALLQTQGLTHLYSVGTPFEHLAVDHVDFTAERGEFIGIIGHTGSGKSTFVQHLNGLLKPTEGKVLLDGEDIFASTAALRRARSRVGLVFQYPEYQLFEETVYRDIAYGPRNLKLTETEIDERVREAADFVGLPEELLQQSPFDISGGQRRRAAIAGVIAMRPDVLVLDEPTAGLDPAGRAEIIANIRRYHRARGGTVLYITHSMEDIARFADRLVVFHRGHLVMNGSPEAVFGRAAELEQIGLSVPMVTRICDALKRRGLDLGTGIYTVEAAVRALTDGRGGNPHA